MDNTDPQMVTIGEAAQALQVSIKTLRRWEQAGYISAQRIGSGYRRFSTDEIERVRNSRTVTAEGHTDN